MLELVLEDEPEDEPSVQERVLCVEIGVLECLEHALADGARVSSDRLRAERRELRTRASRLPEGAGDLVVPTVERRVAVQVPKQPELLEVRDLGELPHER